MMTRLETSPCGRTRRFYDLDKGTAGILCVQGLNGFLTKNPTPGPNSLLALFFILVVLYFSVMPGGVSEGPAGPRTPQSVGKALQCVKSIGVWRAT